MKKNVDSHEYARALQHAAEFLLSRPAFNTNMTRAYSYNFFRYHEKELFVAAVKAVGSGVKEFTDSDIKVLYRQGDVEITIEAPRNTLCRLIRPAEYDCDPFLSPDEEKNLGGAA